MTRAAAEVEALGMQVIEMQEQGDIPGGQGVGLGEGDLARGLRLVQGLGILVEAVRVEALGGVAPDVVAPRDVVLAARVQPATSARTGYCWPGRRRSGGA